MSNLNTITDPFAHSLTTSDLIIMSFETPANQSATVVFICHVKGTPGTTQQGEFSVYVGNDFATGTSAPLAQHNTRRGNPETPQGDWKTWASGQPTPVSAELVEHILVPAQSSGFTPPVEVRGGKTVYLVGKNATNATACVVVGKCNQ